MDKIELCLWIGGAFTITNIIIHLVIRVAFWNDVLRLHNEQKQWYCDLLEALKDLHEEGYRVIKRK